MREAVVVDMVRTPFGRAGQRGAFRDISHVELVVPLLQSILERNHLPAEEVDELLMGSVGLAGLLTRSRHYLFEAGLPLSLRARNEGFFAAEIQPVAIDYSDGSQVAVDTDQCPRDDTSLEKLAQLKPSFP